MMAHFHDTDAEHERIRALEASRLLSAPLPAEVQQICEQAKRRFEVPSALVTLVAADRIVVKAAVGSPLQKVPHLRQFCDEAIRRDEVLVVSDARQHALFASHPMVTSEPFLRFYAGAPLAYIRGVRLGALCLLDTYPRDLSPQESAELAWMADEVVGAVLDRVFDGIGAVVH